MSEITVLSVLTEPLIAGRRCRRLCPMRERIWTSTGRWTLTARLPVRNGCGKGGPSHQPAANQGRRIRSHQRQGTCFNSVTKMSYVSWYSILKSRTANRSTRTNGNQISGHVSLFHDGGRRPRASGNFSSPSILTCWARRSRRIA